MLRRLTAAALMGTFLTGIAYAAGSDFRNHAEGGIRSVTLSSGGLVEVARTARVNGSGVVAITVPIDQVDDVLKSLVVRDGAGTVAGISLAGADTVEETFRKLPFGPDDLGDVGRLVGAMQGTLVTVRDGSRAIKGRSLGVTTTQGPHGETVRTLSVITEDGLIQSIAIGADTSFSIVDEVMRRKVAESAIALGRGKVDGARTIEIRVDGIGEREIGLSYVVPASVWKTAYRVVNDASSGKARLQAWAVIENSTGEDWKGVEVTLSSGAPVTLKQKLHQRYWRDRAEVPVDSDAGQVPPLDKGSRVHLKERGTSNYAAAPQAAPALAMRAVSGSPMMMAEQVEMAPPTDLAVGIEGDVGASYRLPKAVDLASGDTLSVPIVDADVEVDRVSVFRQGTGNIHPISALRIRNGTGASLPPGIVTVYEKGGYAGDARLPATAPGAERMASFATDGKVEITSSESPEQSITQVKVADGMLRASMRTRSVTTYAIKGAPDAPRKIVIEHPARPGWTFSSDAAEEGITPGFHRLLADVAPDAVSKVVAVHEVTNEESISLADADADMLMRWSNGVGDPQVTAKLRELAKARSSLASAETEMRELDADVRRIADDQSRIRENLKAVPPRGELARKYVEQMKGQEAELARLAFRRSELAETIRSHRALMGGIIRTL